MTTTITERDKKLLYFCGIAVFLFFFVRFLFLPALDSMQRAEESLQTAEEARSEMELTIVQSPAAALQVQRVTIASDGVTVLYGKDATNRMDNADFRVNGESVNWGSNSGGIDAEDVFSNYRFMKEYIPLDKLTTIEFVFKTNLD